MTALTIAGLSCRYEQTEVLSNLSLEVEQGEIVCLLGRSGCGKTTLLKAISGLLQPSAGTISLHGQVVSSVHGTLPPERRGMGMIFQDYALFPHLTVFHNIAFGLKNLSRKDTRRRVEAMLELVNLSGLDKRYPHELSGGQQQRVAIARALANSPSLLLLDEPFSNIDSQVRQRLVREVRDILKQQKVTGLFVTHNRDEGFAFADSVAIMHDGNILQRGHSFDVYNRPASRFVAEFMGSGNLLPCEVINSRTVSTPVGVVESSTDISADPGQTAELFIRPQMFSIERCQCENPLNPAQIKSQQFMGTRLRTEVKLEENILVVENSTPFPESTPVDISVRPHDLLLFDQKGYSI
ncbi:ABC transporter ATP-binding protein [Endozoicomonas sp. 8E]|uniref:ABC transporter ATP-binding protein n=1 Tax=Endozoicomonas sp. 8E TaxID=3035692 RepID=UPI0029395133|nr:ABC transporter ATP-binding protein [Endozoicomonas sp. 8E]WOG28087.1 ABC transporter ATP-binding protein [Endozoicomonas sp. 8E]